MWHLAEERVASGVCMHFGWEVCRLLSVLSAALQERVWY
jgi:hypothetical protein